MKPRSMMLALCLIAASVTLDSCIPENPVDLSPPSLISDLVLFASGSDQMTLTWTNPIDSDLAEVVVRRRLGTYPTDHLDGDNISNCHRTTPNPGVVERCVDAGSGGAAYYYAVFSRDRVGNWNDQVVEGKNARASSASPATHKPVADFSFSPASPKINEIVQFTDRSSDLDNDIQSWAWDFGDGATSLLQNPSHEYSRTGSFTVKLTVRDTAGNTDSIQKDITVSDGGGRRPDNIVPSVDFSFSPESPMVGQTVQFTDKSKDPDGKIVAWKWDFGDGGTSELQNPTYVYRTPGTFKVKLIVTDDRGGQAGASLEKAITVREISSTPTPGCTVVISPRDSIAQAIDAATAGATICLTAGTWTEGDVIITKSLTIRSSGGNDVSLMARVFGYFVVILLDPDAPVIIENLNIAGGVDVFEKSRVMMHGVIINMSGFGVGFGISAMEDSQVSLMNVVVSDSFIGVSVYDSARAIVSQSAIFNNQWGIFVEDSARVSILDSIIRDNASYGIYAEKPESIVECRGNILENNRMGDYGSEAVAQRCK